MVGLREARRCPRARPARCDRAGVDPALRARRRLDAEPYESAVEARLAAWLARQEQAGVTFTVDQVWWLEQIADVVVTSLGCSADDLDQVPFTERGGVDGFTRAFGEDRAADLLDELNRELPA